MRSDYKTQIKRERKAAYDMFIKNSKYKVKDSWKVINFERNRVVQRDEVNISPERFNTFFSGVAEEIIRDLKQSDIDPINILPDNNVSSPNKSLFMEPVTVDEIMLTVRSLNNSNSLDVYNLNSKLIKNSIDIIAYPLTQLINTCFSKGIFPDILKYAAVIPVFKNGDKDCVNNYRPISILPIFGKILEILIKKRLIKFFDANCILSACQFGFRSDNSTIHAVSKVVRNIVDGFEEKNHTAVTLCDLSKAFDCVSHDVLLEKLNYYGIRGIPLKLLKSYLSNRRQSVRLSGSSMSETLPMSHGVPQGSVLGPLLFIIYINDLCKFLGSDRCALFADDTTLITSDNDYNLLLSKTIELVNKTSSWFTANKLQLNSNKTQRLVCSPNPSVGRGENVKILGVIVDNSLNWLPHINQLSCKLSSSTFVLRRLSSLCTTDTLKMAYHSLFHSHLLYGIILWGNCSHAIKIFKIQKRAVRVIAGVGYREHCRPYFIKFRIMTLPCAFIFNSLLEIHKNGLHAPKHSDNHSYNTRNAGNFQIPKFRLTKSNKNTLDYKLYNILPRNLRQLNLNLFKKSIKHHLLKNAFYTINEYLETHVE